MRGGRARARTRRRPGDAVTAPSVSRDTAPEAWSFGRAIKDRVVEEPINLYWHRRLAYALLLPLRRAVWVTPLRLTLASGVVGVLAGIAAYRAADHDAAWFAASALLLLASSVVDCADGMLARLRGQSSRLGGLIDGVTDAIVGLAATIGLAHALATRLPAQPVWPVAAAILASVVVHVALYDHYKERYLAACAGGPSPTREAGGAGRAERALGALYVAVYYRIAAVLVPSFSRPPSLPADVEIRRRHLAPPMRLAAWLGLGTQLLGVYISALLAALEPEAALTLLGVLFLVVFNVLTVAVILAWRRADRALAPGHLVRLVEGQP
jgi:phosphatidylglycerophosphate synthase